MWNVVWIGLGEATYEFHQNGGVLILKVLVSTWGFCYKFTEENPRCQGIVYPSTSQKHPAGDGWFQVDKIEASDILVYVRRNSTERLELIWTAPGYDDNGGTGVKVGKL